MTGRELNRLGRSHDWYTDDVCAAIIEDAEDQPVEGIAVLVVTADEATAREVGPLLAARLHPGRRFGAVLHTEPIGDATEVVVRAY